MKIILAPDSFKGTFTSMQVIEILCRSIEKELGSHEIIKAPVADGGEGTTEALVIAANGKYRSAYIPGSLGGPEVQYGVIWGDTAVIEMAAVAGLTQVKEKNPLKISSSGLGELISTVMADGFKKIMVGIGGSATNDGGMGMLCGLGAKFYANGKLLAGNAEDLEKVDDIDFTGLDKNLAGTEITVICDVTNPLLGPQGATRIYGPQKGATGKLGDRLEAGMAHYAQVIEEKLGTDIRNAKGAGAAGGVGAALFGILNANMQSGIEAVLQAIHFDDMLNGADLVVTGEGRLDGQSVEYGKVPAGIAKRCEKAGVPVAILAGSLGDGWEKILDIKKLSVMSTIDRPMSMEQIRNGTEKRLALAADRMFRFIQLTVDS